MFRPPLLLTAATALLAAGGGSPPPERDVDPNLGPEGYAVVRVDNRSISDMRVYVRPGAGGARYRLGTASGLRETVLKIPRSLVTGITELTFELTPMGGGRRAFSEKITAHPGEEIVLRIGP